MSAVSDILFVVSVLREHGVTVTFEPGWELRGNGQSTESYDGSLIHHTGTPGVSYTNPGPTLRVLRDGRSDLPGPLCNGQGKFDGSVHIIAAHPANHAGASGGPSMGPLPVTRLFNPRVMGWEFDYAGNTPMSPEQYRTAQVIAEATRRLRGRPSMEWTRAHAETSIEGKWDPGYAPGKTINMTAFRADATTLEDDLATPNEIWMFPLRNAQNADGKEEIAPAVLWLTEIADKVELLMRKLPAVASDVAAVKSDVADVKAAVAGLQTGTGYTLAQLVTALADEQDRRARDNNPATGPVS